MINALHSAATGMEAQQTRIDAIANDLANVSTVGYKTTRPEFEDLYYDQVKTPGNKNNENVQSPNGIQLGHGVKMTSMTKVFTPGDVDNTGQPLDVAIAGHGFFQLTDENGNPVYSRNGVFQVNADGEIVNTNGLRLEPTLSVPQNTTSITIGTDGTVSIKTSETGDSQELGKIEVAMFQNPSGLENLGGNIYRATNASGAFVTVTPGKDGSGKLQQGFLEHSNVNVGETLINMVVAQRSYESNAKVIETADRMMQAVNNIL